MTDGFLRTRMSNDVDVLIERACVDEQRAVSEHVLQTRFVTCIGRTRTNRDTGNNDVIYTTSNNTNTNSLNIK